jgi:AraC-like DNA-binding protein
MYLNPDILPKIYLKVAVTRRGGWGHDFVTKPYHLILLMNSGRVKITVEERTFLLSEDDILLIPKNTPYSLESACDFEHTVIHFDADIREEDDIEAAFIEIPTRARADSALKYSIERAVKSEGDAQSDECERRLSLMSALIALSKAANTENEGRTVSKIKRYLSEHIKEHLSLDELARAFGYSKQYLIRVYKKATGLSPIAALNGMRLSKGAQLLLFSEGSLAEVAEACGFDDYNYFSRQFRKKYGRSPIEYRRIHSVL